MGIEKKDKQFQTLISKKLMTGRLSIREVLEI